jgi:ABC-type transport system involved in multi-copper enzyme maturation permease subunit
VRALVGAELLKLLSTRMQAGLLFASLAMVIMTVAFTVPSAGETGGLLPLDESQLLARVVAESFGVPQVLMVLLGVLAVTQEFRYGTATSTFLVAPGRPRVLGAKWLAVAVASLPLTVMSLVVSLAVTVPLIRSRDGNLTAGAELWQVVAATFGVMALYGVLGVAIGALVRNQIAAVVGVLVWMLAVDQIVTTSYPAVGKWLPGGAAYGFLHLGSSITAKGDLLSASAGGLVLLGYAAVAGVLAFAVMPKRDIL